MKLLLVITIGFLVASAEAGPVSQARDKRSPIHGAPDYLNFKCEGLEDGFYADRLRGCHQYYECKDGEKTTHFCEDHSYIFNQDRWACVPATSYSCPSMNKRSQNLVKKAQSHGSPDYLNFKCEGLEDGFYADRLRGCHQYYVCKEGEKTTHFCKQAGYIFNEDLWACVPGTSYSCPSVNKRSQNLVKKAQSHGSPDYLNFKCEGLEDGFYADRLRGCHQYYVCKEGEKTTHFCKQAGYIFNEDLWACVPGTSYSCPAMDKHSLAKRTPIHGMPDYLNFKCEGLPDGLYADRLRGCHQFYSCKSEHKETHFCEDNRNIFNDALWACVPPTTYSCPPVDQDDSAEGTSSRCAGVEDGYYADLSTNCEKFYRCHEGNVFEFSCAPGLRFDEKEEVCTWADHVPCSNVEMKRSRRVSELLRELKVVEQGQ